MKLTSRELAWTKRKANSHPTYDKNFDQPKCFKERMKKANIPKPFTKEALERSKEFDSKYGRCWWFYVGVNDRHDRPKVWFDQNNPTLQGKNHH